MNHQSTESTIKSQRNTNIELMRFIFCLIIIFLHTGMRYCSEFNVTPPTFFRNGRIGVEFFFIVSGYLLMNSLNKVDKTLPIYKNTQVFMLKKLTGIFPYHLVAFCSAGILYFIANHSNVHKDLETLVKFIPNLFFFQRLGYPEKTLVNGEWYISAMLLSMFILLPFILKFKENFTRIVCPVIAIAGIGFIVNQSGTLGIPQEFIVNGLIPKGQLRGFVEICLGIFVYEIAKEIQKIDFGKVAKLILTIIEFICYAGPIYYTCSGDDLKYDSYVALALAVGIAITFSGKTYFNNIVNPKLSGFLGKISFPLYLGQAIPFLFIDRWLPDARFRYQLIAVFILNGIMIPIILLIGNKLKKPMVKFLKSNSYI